MRFKTSVSVKEPLTLSKASSLHFTAHRTGLEWKAENDDKNSCQAYVRFCCTILRSMGPDIIDGERSSYLSWQRGLLLKL
nr:hypothetical protein CFP56_78303 [Quercus suber]